MNLYALDTDILSLYQRGHPTVCQNVVGRLSVELATTVINVEEQLSGWYALLRVTTRHDHLERA